MEGKKDKTILFWIYQVVKLVFDGPCFVSTVYDGGGGFVYFFYSITYKGGFYAPFQTG